MAEPGISDGGVAVAWLAGNWEVGIIRHDRARPVGYEGIDLTTYIYIYISIHICLYEIYEIYILGFRRV